MIRSTARDWWIAAMTLIVALTFMSTSSNGQVNTFLQKPFVPTGPTSFDTVGRKASEKLIAEATDALEVEIDPTAYIVGPGDRFTIRFSSAITEDIETVVSPEGYLLVPKGGNLKVKGITLDSARSLVQERLSRVFKGPIGIALSKLRRFKVYVLGAVRIPSVVTATGADRVFDVLHKAGGIIDTGSVRGIIVLREGQTDPIRVDLQRYLSFGDKTSNPTVLGGDRIIVPLRNDRNTIGISGEVQQQSEFDFVEGDSLSTLIRLAGGFLPSAFMDSVSVVRVDERGTTLNTITINTKTWAKDIYTGRQLEGDIPLQVGDRVYVRAIPKWKQRAEIVIEGEVKYPGRYAITPLQTRVTDIIAQAGGFTEKAALEDAIMIRTSEVKIVDREYDRLSKLPPSEMSENELQYFKTKSREVKGVLSVNFVDLFEKGILDNNPVLHDKDSVFIPAKNLYINITGSVRNPGRIVYKSGLNYMDYISLAGGYGFRADKNATLVIKTKGDQFPASSDNYSLEPGDNILVLDEPETRFIDVFTQVLTISAQIVTVFGVIYTVVRLR